MELRNIQFHLPGEDKTDYDASHNYLEKIEGERYEFFISALGGNNSVEWDKNENAYHLINKTADESDDRAFIFDRDYLTNIINHTKAEAISFEYRYDGQRSGCETDDHAIYQGFWPNWYDTEHMQRLNPVAEWNKIEIKFSDIPRDAQGNLKTPFIMNTIGGLYIRNITLHLPKVYEVCDCLNLAEYNLTWKHGVETGLTGGNNLGALSYTENGFKLEDCYAYSTHKFMLKYPAGFYEDGMTLRMWIKATPNGADMSNLELRFYNCNTTGSIGDNIEYTSVKVPAQGEWVSIEMSLDKFLDANKKLRGISFATFGYKDWSSGQAYTIEVDKIEILSSHEQR